MEKYIERINEFLTAATQTLSLRFNDGMFMDLKKHIKNGKRFLEIHTAGYDGTLEINAAISWIDWTLYDYSINGFLADR